MENCHSPVEQLIDWWLIYGSTFNVCPKTSVSMFYTQNMYIPNHTRTTNQLEMEIHHQPEDEEILPCGQ